jgi:hypothetical protein
VAGEAHFEEYGKERQGTAFFDVPRATKSKLLFAFLDFAHLKYGFACPDDGRRSLGNLQCLLRGSPRAPTRLNLG